MIAVNNSEIRPGIFRPERDLNPTCALPMQCSTSELSLRSTWSLLFSGEFMRNC